jgi:hypothetical protein
MQNWVMGRQVVERRLCHALLVDRPRRARDEDDSGVDQHDHRKRSKVDDGDDEMLCEHNDEGKRVIILHDDEKAFDRKRRK